MIDILIKNAQIVTVNKGQILQDSAIAIKGNKIIDIGDSKELSDKYQEAGQVIDAAGKVVFPGMINTHNHLFQTLFKGLGDDMVIGDWLKKVAYPLSTNLTVDLAYTGAMLGLMESLHSGITTSVDYMYAHPVAGLSDAVIKAMNDLKVRGIYARGFLSGGQQFGAQESLMETPEEVIKDFKYLYDKYQKKQEDGRISIWLAPSNMWANTKEMLKKTYDLANEYKVGYTVHISETETPRKFTQEIHGFSDAALLEELGIVGPNVLMVHCVAITDDDIAMIKKYDMKVSHNPVCNMYLASGVAPVPKMIAEGITVSLGIDGAASNNSQDMIETLKATALLHKVSSRDPKIITAEKVLELATIDGARAIGMEDQIGSIEIGKKADMFIFNPSLAAKSTPMHNPISTLVYSSNERNVETVIIDGKVVLEDGKIVDMDEIAFYKKAQKISVDAANEFYSK